MNAKTSETFAPGRRDSIDSDFHDCEPSFGPQSTQVSTESQSWVPSSSSSSTMSQPGVHGHGEPQSCVSRSPVTQDCATQQFLVWAAIKRNRSVKMAVNERLACPLVRCGERFEEHEAMLRHLSKCQHLKTGEYLCYECMQVERFNDGSRRCCSAQPSKRRKIVKLAKNFFSNIGNKTRRSESEAMDQDDTASLPPAYDDMVEMSPVEFNSGTPNPQLELNGNEIVEMDGEVVYQLDSVNYDADQARYTSTQAESSTNVAHNVSNNPSSQPQYPLLSLNKQLPHRNMAPTPARCSPSGIQRPSLALNTEVDQYRITHGKYLTPSSSVRSHQSSQQSAHIISPITPWSASSAASGVSTDPGMMSSGVNTHMTSPTSPVSPLGNSASMMHSYSAPKSQDFSTYGDNPAGIYCDKARSKRAVDYSHPNPRASDIPEHILFPSTEERDAYSWMSSNNTELALGTSINVMSFSDNAGFPNDFAPYTETAPATDAGKLLVESVWDALRQHVESSSSKVLELGSNPLAVRLRQESAASVAIRGFESLRSIINGKDPSDPLDYLCFVHLVYAFSLVLHEDDLARRSELLFKQALAYRGFLNPAWNNLYSQVVLRIWNPDTHTTLQDNNLLTSHQRLSSRVTSGQLRATPDTPADRDALTVVSQNFLDEFESLVLNSKSMRPADIVSSPLWSMHVEDLRDRGASQPFAAGANFIINVLSQSFRDNPGLAPCLRSVAQRVRSQDTSTVRRLELELMQAGKIVLSKPHFFDTFVPQVRRHCNTLYIKHSTNPRARYHTLAASFAEQLLNNAARESSTPQQSHATGMSTLPLNSGLDDFFQLPMDEHFSLPGGMENFQQAHLATGVQRYPGTGPINPMLNIPDQQHMDITSLNMHNRSPYPTPFPQQGVSTPDLITAECSPAIITATIPLEPQVPAGNKRKASNMQDRQHQTKKPHIRNKENPAQTPSGSPAQGSATPQVEANSCCEICGYRPKGDPQWFKGSMAKHKKLQHSDQPPTIYKCQFPGCTSAYKNRQDNLRQHQIEKNHFVDDQGQQRRPSKRKRAS